jgi:hypothetical protein
LARGLPSEQPGDDGRRENNCSQTEAEVLAWHREPQLQAVYVSPGRHFGLVWPRYPLARTSNPLEMEPVPRASARAAERRRREAGRTRAWGPSPTAEEATWLAPSLRSPQSFEGTHFPQGPHGSHGLLPQGTSIQPSAGAAERRRSADFPGPSIATVASWWEDADRPGADTKGVLSCFVD